MPPTAISNPPARSSTTKVPLRRRTSAARMPKTTERTAASSTTSGAERTGDQRPADESSAGGYLQRLDAQLIPHYGLQSRSQRQSKQRHRAHRKECDERV